jgi:pSer/pThr/pTyr-binding forkhead associated (FHA) protein
MAHYRCAIFASTHYRNIEMADNKSTSLESSSSAYLIVNSEVYQISGALTNMGRKLDNHVVLNDPRVSRNHAQIRMVDNQYILLDLNSTGGTSVNGKKVSKSVLYSGDTISLAGLEVKFVQDTPRMISKAMERTGPLKNFRLEEVPTFIMKDRPTENSKPQGKED